MSISGISPTGRVPPQTASTASPAGTSAATDQTLHLGTEIDEKTQQPVPPRFPWLSRLSAQLEKASNQPSPFAPAPLLGDHLDRSV